MRGLSELCLCPHNQVIPLLTRASLRITEAILTPAVNEDLQREICIVYRSYVIHCIPRSAASILLWAASSGSHRHITVSGYTKLQKSIMSSGAHALIARYDSLARYTRFLPGLHMLRTGKRARF